MAMESNASALSHSKVRQQFLPHSHPTDLLYLISILIAGELIETSGTLSGGGKSSSGRMGRKVATDTSGTETSARDIALMETKLQELTEQCSQLRQRKVQIEDSLQEVNRFANDGATNLKKWRMEINV